MSEGFRYVLKHSRVCGTCLVLHTSRHVPRGMKSHSAALRQPHRSKLLLLNSDVRNIVEEESIQDKKKYSCVGSSAAQSNAPNSRIGISRHAWRAASVEVEGRRRGKNERKRRSKEEDISEEAGRLQQPRRQTFLARQELSREGATGSDRGALKRREMQVDRSDMPAPPVCRLVPYSSEADLSEAKSRKKQERKKEERARCIWRESKVGLKRCRTALDSYTDVQTTADSSVYQPTRPPDTPGTRLFQRQLGALSLVSLPLFSLRFSPSFGAWIDYKIVSGLASALFYSPAAPNLASQRTATTAGSSATARVGDGGNSQ